MSQDTDDAFESILRQADAGYTNDQLLTSITQCFAYFTPSSLTAERAQTLRKVLEILSKVQKGSLELMSSLISRYPANTLTIIHPYFVRQCCLMRSYATATQLTSSMLQSVPKGTHLVYQDLLLYHFYGGMCFAGLRDYARATYFLSLVISSPGNNTSTIQVNAYKKYVILCLIDGGQLVPIPDSTSQNTKRTLEVLSTPYIEFAKAFLNDDLSKVLAKYGREFVSDNNSGLINTALVSVPVHKIMNLRKIYSTIPLARLSEMIGLHEDETETTLQRMVSDGQIVSSLDEDKFVLFPLTESSTETNLSELAKEYQSIEQLNQRLLSLQESMELDPYSMSKQAGGPRKGKGKQRALPMTAASHTDRPIAH